MGMIEQRVGYSSPLGVEVKESHFSVGRLAIDRVHEMWVMIVSDPYSRADEVVVNNRRTVSEWGGNERFPDDDPVVDARMLLNLEEDGTMIYTYPRSRLCTVRDTHEQFWDWRMGV